MKTPKAKIRRFFLGCLRWRYPHISIQICRAGCRDYHPGWWKMCVCHRLDPYWKCLVPGFNLPVTIQGLIEKMGVPREAWDCGPNFGEAYYIHLNPAYWDRQLA